MMTVEGGRERGRERGRGEKEEEEEEEEEEIEDGRRKEQRQKIEGKERAGDLGWANPELRTSPSRRKERYTTEVGGLPDVQYPRSALPYFIQ
ncbi:hypothetical protein BO94DRAFT_125042 [Aspergillus sclerotioniger CBS 115572]|uniref:Uncharacterized protein n=1 Tax=Aspergillus sclerotioniger CBS 115572 TaxID=1450535 RepID=A0A317WGJ9_9EURO|nr:hypothetical protein BO94DRAFT_125042 [Aspergillus sclerotioniger CBS 115572]PWY83320.1 hypothetical protein BO94DRAFT_125042 [Aspergillus sclerotioniger CBS 115572]